MEVICRGDIEGALRILRKAIEKDGIFREIRMRELRPNKTDRKKMKASIANRRRIKSEERRNQYRRDRG
jgi:ribosomal protein S21